MTATTVGAGGARAAFHRPRRTSIIQLDHPTTPARIACIDP
jgi:hypothetical protein